MIDVSCATNRARNKARDLVAQELGIDREKLSVSSTVTNQSNVIDIEVFGKDIDRTYFTTTLDTLQLVKVLIYYR